MITWTQLVANVIAQRPIRDEPLHLLSTEQVAKLTHEELSHLVAATISRGASGTIRSAVLENPQVQHLPGIDVPLRELVRVKRNGVVDWQAGRFCTVPELIAHEEWMIQQWAARVRDAEARIPRLWQLQHEIESTGHDPEVTCIDEWRWRGKVCEDCGGAWRPDDPLTFDHDDPIEWGNGDDNRPENIKIRHRSCNSRKSDRH